MKILVFGSSGQVGKEFRSLSEKKGLSSTFLDRTDANFLYPESCGLAVAKHNPEVVLNFAAYTQVDACESDEKSANLVNGETPGAIARVCRDLSIPLLHISSDYVFDGTGDKPWEPNDLPNPINSYGRSKLLGEVLVRASNARAIVLRTSWVFSRYGANFVKTMLRLGEAQKKIKVVDDQIGGPTSAKSIAETSYLLAIQLAKGASSATFHFSGEPYVTWANFAERIMKLCNFNCEIEPISSSHFPTIAKRPLNSKLDCHALREKFAIGSNPWQDDLVDLIGIIKAQN